MHATLASPSLAEKRSASDPISSGFHLSCRDPLFLYVCDSVCDEEKETACGPTSVRSPPDLKSRRNTALLSLRTGDFRQSQEISFRQAHRSTNKNDNSSLPQNAALLELELSKLEQRPPVRIGEKIPNSVRVTFVFPTEKTISSARKITTSDSFHSSLSMEPSCR